MVSFVSGRSHSYSQHREAHERALKIKFGCELANSKERARGLLHRLFSASARCEGEVHLAWYERSRHQAFCFHRVLRYQTYMEVFRHSLNNRALHCGQQQWGKQGRSQTMGGWPTWRETLGPRTKYTGFQIECSIQKERWQSLNEIQWDLDLHSPQTFLFSWPLEHYSFGTHEQITYHVSDFREEVQVWKY